MVVLAACTPIMRLGDGEVIVDEGVYPGTAGPVVAEVAHTDEHAARLWEAVGFAGQAPTLDGTAIVVVAGAADAGCPWDLTERRLRRTSGDQAAASPERPPPTGHDQAAGTGRGESSGTRQLRPAGSQPLSSASSQSAQ